MFYQSSLLDKGSRDAKLVGEINNINNRKDRTLPTIHA